MENTELHKLADQYYQEFMSDDSIIGFEGLLKSKGLGSKRRVRVRNLIYEKYGKEKLIALYRSRLAKSAHKNRSPESYYISPERRLKMIEGIKKSWESSDSRREQSRYLMLEHCQPRCQTPSAKEKRVKSRKWYHPSEETKEKMSLAQKGRVFSEEQKQKMRHPKSVKVIKGPHTQATRDRLSLITKQQWKDGIHKPIYKSKGHVEIMEILKVLGYEIQDEYVINGKPYDVLIKSRNLLIEFNGTFWHRDPRVEKYRNDPLSPSIWKRDSEKIDSAKNNGYDIKVIWQSDWENCQDKNKYIEDILC